MKDNKSMWEQFQDQKDELWGLQCYEDFLHWNRNCNLTKEKGNE